MIECCFCASGDSAADALEERISWQDDRLYVTPSIGPLGREHLLVIPRAHIPSFAHLDVETALRAEDVIRDQSAILSDERSKVLLFEHGMAAHTAAGGCGISHAHIHLIAVPRSFQLVPLPEPDREHSWEALPGDGFLTALAGLRGYLAVGCEGTYWSRSVEQLPSQYLRQWVAKRLSVDQWDWRRAGGRDLKSRALDLRARHRATGNSAA